MNFTKGTNTSFSVRKTHECNSPPQVRKLNKEGINKYWLDQQKGGKMHLEIPKTFLNGISERRNKGTWCTWQTALGVCSVTPAVLRGLIGDALPWTLEQEERTCSRPSWQFLGGGTSYEKDPREVEEHGRKKEIRPYPADGVTTRIGNASQSTVKTLEWMKVLQNWGVRFQWCDVFFPTLGIYNWNIFF